MEKKLYKVYNGKVIWVNVTKETKCFYFINESIPAFGFLIRIEKNEAMLTPHEAVQEAITNQKTMIGAIRDRLAKRKIELKALENLSHSCDFGKPTFTCNQEILENNEGFLGNYTGNTIP